MHDNCSITDPLIFQTICFICEEGLPMSCVSLGSLNVNSGSGIVFFEEFDFNSCFLIESFNFVTLFFSTNFVRLNDYSDVLGFFLCLVIVNNIISFIFSFCESPFICKLVCTNIVLEIIPNGSWFDGFCINIIR